MKTLAMLALGLLLAMVGLDVVTGMLRFTFGPLTLLSGFHFVPLTIGLYGLGEILASAEEGVAKLEGLAGQVGFRDVREALHELWSRFPTLLSSTFWGSGWVFCLARVQRRLPFWVTVLPGSIPDVETRLARVRSKASSRPRQPHRRSVLVLSWPMLTLGIPGSPTAAVLLGGLFIWGLLPGPQLFVETPDFVWGLVASM